MSTFKTRSDLKKEAQKHIDSKSPLYEDALIYLMDNFGHIDEKHLLKEVMRLITHTDSSFEHLAE